MFKVNKRKILIGCIVAVLILATGYFVLNKSDNNLDAKSGDKKTSVTKLQMVSQRPLSTTYKKVAENDDLELYLKESNLAIQVKNKKTGYLWNSVVEEKNGKLNSTWKNFFASGISFEYFQKGVAAAKDSDLLTETNKTIVINYVDNGFEAKVYFYDLGISLKLIVTLDGKQLVVKVPNKDIQEVGDKGLANLNVYPMLGATHLGTVPGYMFIPDGSGALIDLKNNGGKFLQPYDEKIYGKNDGLEVSSNTTAVDGDSENKTEGGNQSVNPNLTTPPYKVQYPVFGMVHGVKKNGVFAVIEEGQYNARLLAYPNGVNTDYNWITARYVYRENYIHLTSRTGGLVDHETDRNIENIKTRYFFLDNENADYVGMAKTYQNYLREKHVLKAKTDSKNDVPIQLDVLGAESENGLVSKKLVPMTTVKQFEKIVSSLQEAGIKNQTLVFKGWNKGGLSGTTPYDIQFEGDLGSSDEFNQFTNKMKKDDIPLYFYNDYTKAFESNRFSPRVDAVKRVDKTLLEFLTYKPTYEKYFLLSAKSANGIVDKDIKAYKEENVSNVAIGTTGEVLFSEWTGSRASKRVETKQKYDKMIKKLKGNLNSVVLYSPNDYMLSYSDSVLNIPMQSSQFTYVSETVPFVQIVLKGYKDYYAPYTNFATNPKKSKLQMIEYGAYPSYLLTSRESNNLKFTNSNDIYTSAFKDWRNDIVESYMELNEALKKVQNASIVNRKKISSDVIEVEYSNGIKIYVNYTNKEYKGDVIVPAEGFNVIEVKQ